MKIGIVTLPLHTNYGGIMQAYALQTVLERLGHDVVLFDRNTDGDSSMPWWRAVYGYPMRVARKIVRPSTVVFREQKYRAENVVRRRYTDRFIARYIHRIRPDDYMRIPNDGYDAVIAGSDQVWRPKYFHKTIDDAFLRFAGMWQIRRIAYGASFGTDEWEYTPEQTFRCGALLRRFDAVSVREDDAVQMCREHFGADAELVLDPTLLLEAEDYMRLVDKSWVTRSEGNLMRYILDRSVEKEAVVRKIASDGSMTPFGSETDIYDRGIPLELRVQPPVEKWLRGFADADMVVTDSFHACVFSIIFRKPFIVFANKARGFSRFRSLLRLMGLEDRLMMSPDSRIPDSGIDYDRVYERLGVMRRKSMDFLTSSLAPTGC